MNTHLYKYCLRLADNSLILGHRLGEYSSNGPFLEEDLAITNVALDLIGQAEELLKYAAEVKSDGSTEDDLAYRRFEHEYFNNLITEQPNSDFAYVTVRQFFMDAFNFYLYSQLQESKDPTLAAIAAKSIKEVTYHLRRSSEWMIRLGKGTEESAEKVQQAVDHLWKFTDELFEIEEADQVLLAKGIACDMSLLKENWQKKIKEIFKMADLSIPENPFGISGSRQGYHTEHMGYILAEMQFLPRTYPDATW